MPTLKEISETATPELFFMPRDTGEVDEDSNPIIAYDLDHEDMVVEVPEPYRGFKKKIKDGLVGELRVYADRFELYKNDVLIATSVLIGEVWAGGQWRSRQFDFTMAEIVKKDTWTWRAFVVRDIPALGVTNAVFGMEVQFSRKKAKQTFYVDVPGRLVRPIWEVTTYGVDEDFLVNADDYTGNKDIATVDNGDGSWTTTYIFEPNGFQCPAGETLLPLDGLMVDPYLDLTEAASTYTVTFDSGDIVVWTIATAGAVLKEPGSVRVWIRETYYDWFAYDNILMRFQHNTGASITGAALDGGNTHCVAGNLTQVLKSGTSATAISDDFSGNLDNWTDDQARGNYSIVGGELQDGDTGDTVWYDYIRYSDEALSSINGWIKVKLVSVADYAGVLFRSSGGSGSNYKLLFSPTADTADWGVYGIGSWTEDVRAGASITHAAGDIIGVTWEGTGDSTVVRCWVNPSAAVPISASSWDAADDSDLELTDNPSNPVDVGAYVGLCSDEGVTTFDNFSAGAFGPLYFYPTDATTVTNIAAVETELEDQTLPAFTTGDKVTDLNVPDIQADCFSGDGAFHGDSELVSSKPNAKIDFTGDTNRANFHWVDHNFGFISGDPAGSPTDHWMAHWKLDDNAATKVVLSEIDNANWEAATVTDNTEDMTAVDAVRGTCLETNGTDNYIDLPVYNIANWKDDFTLIFDFKPTFALGNTPLEGLLQIRYDNDNRIYLDIDDSGGFNRLELNAFEFNNVPYYPSAPISGPGFFASEAELQQWHNLRFVFSITNSFAQIYIDGQIVWNIRLAADVAWGTAPNTIYLGYTQDGYGAYKFDNVKLLSGAILPYGAYFTGNGSVDTAKAHSDVLLYWDCEASGASATQIPATKTVTLSSATISAGANLYGTNGLDIGGEGNNASIPITTEDIIDMNKGSIAFCFNVQTWNNEKWLFTVSEGEDNYIGAFLIGDDDITFRYRHNGTSEDVTSVSAGIATGAWHYFQGTYDDTGSVRLFIDGVEKGTANAVSAADWAGDGTGTLYFGGDYEGSNGCDFFMDGIYITSDPNTPQIWTAFGKPLWTPEVKKDGTVLQAGDDFQHQWLPDGSIMITDLTTAGS